MFCVSELNHDTSLTAPHFICHALVTWAMKLAIDSLIICNLSLSFHGQGYAPSYTFSCYDRKCCVSILDRRWLWLSLSMCSVVSDSATPRTVAHQSPLSMAIFQTRTLEQVVTLLQGNLPNPEIKPTSLVSLVFTQDHIAYFLYLILI